MDYPIPFHSAHAFATRDTCKPQNPGLIFDRFAPDWGSDASLKKDGLEKIGEASKSVDKNLLKDLISRWRKSAEWVKAAIFPARTDWRFVAGLGRKGPLEVGFTFHRYGFPILPGSSVKGTARAYASVVESLDETNQDFLKVFGRAPASGQDQSLAQSGGAVFLDAIPAGPPTLQLDVMNPHFPQYYQDKQDKTAPTDDQNPIPIYFLTVAPNTEFLFAVGWRGQLDEEGRRLRDLAKEWLLKGLTELGAGAKTSAGYGYFLAVAGTQHTSVPKPAPATVAQSMQMVEAAPPAPLNWRKATVREYRPDKRWGHLIDAESGEELRFEQEAIQEKSWSPGRKSVVMYALGERGGKRLVIRVRKG